MTPFKRFNFFTSGLAHTLDSDAVCAASGHGQLVVGLSSNQLVVLSASSASPKPAKLDGPSPVRAVCAISQGVVSVHDQLVVLVWRCNPAWTSRRRLVVASEPDKRWPAATCVAASGDGRRIAVGLADGNVVLLIGDDVCRELRAQRPSSCINGLGFSRDASVLWIASDNGVWTHVEGAGFDVLDADGCNPLCASLAPDDCFAVAHSDRIALFTTETQGSCYAVAGEKLVLGKARTHVIVVFQGPVWRPKLPHVASAPSDTRHTIQVLDLHNKIICHEFPLGRDAADGRALFACGDDMSGSVFLVTSTRRVWRFAELDLESKLDELVKRNLYSTAIALAKASDHKTISNLYQLYGDHLYDKGNFDDAVTQYIRTIGQIEPSYVIRKFLDAPRLRNLTTYLEALLLPELAAPSPAADSENNAGQPSADHTTLLLNCYTRLKDAAGIAALLARPDARVDVDAALAVLRETGRLEQALLLAKDRKRHAWYVRTVLEEQWTGSLPGACQHVLDYLAGLGEDAVAIDLLQVHAAALMQALPGPTTDALIKHIAKPASPFPAEALLDVLVDFPAQLEMLLHECIQLRDNLPTSVWTTLLELCIRSGHFDQAMAVLRDPRAKYEVLAALAMMRAKGFKTGEMYLLERSEMWDSLLSLHMQEGGDDEQVLALALARDRGEIDTWMRVLAYFVNKQDIAMVKRALRHIDQSDVIPPLLVLRILSAQPTLPLEAARTYLAGQIERAVRQAEQDEKEVAQLRLDTEELRAQSKALRDEPRVFSATVCSMTGAPLELPAVHFLTMNSYNLSSLPGGGSLDNLEDPKCAAEQRAISDVAKGLAKRRADVDEEFFNEIDQARGEAGFSLVAEYFSRCLFDDEDM